MYGGKGRGEKKKEKKKRGISISISSRQWHVPRECDVVGKEGGPVGMDHFDGQPQHEQHRAPKNHHGGQEATCVSHYREVNHLKHKPKHKYIYRLPINIPVPSVFRHEFQSTVLNFLS